MQQLSMTQTQRELVRIDPLLEVIAAVRRHARWVWMATAVLGLIGSLAGLLVAALLLDHYLVLPAVLRVILLLTVVAVPVLVVRRLWRDRPERSPQEIALQIEKRFTDLDNRLINSLQLVEADQHNNQELVAAIADEAQQAVARVRPASAVPKRTLFVVLLITLIAGVMLTSHATAHRASIGAGLSRVLLPLADNTLTRIVSVAPGDADVLMNADVGFAIRLEGRTVTQADLEIELADGTQITLPMTAESDTHPERLSTTFERIESDARYRIIAGDARTRRYEIRVHQPPTVQRITHTITPPAYLNDEPVEQVGGTIQAIKGSQVELIVHASQPLQAARLAFDDGEQIELSLSESRSGPGAIGQTVLAVNTPRRYALQLTNVYGFKNDPVSFDILPIVDQPPTVTFLQPAGDISADIDVRLPLELQATDDHALREVHLVQLKDSDGATDDAASEKTTTLHTWPITNHEDRATLTHDGIDLAECGLSPEQPVRLRILAYDHQPNGPSGVSSILTIRFNDPADSTAQSNASATSVSLNRLIARQRANLTATGNLRDATEDARTSGHAAVISEQEAIRNDAVSIAARADAGPAIARLLTNLAETLMIVAIEQLRAAGATVEFQPGITAATDTQQAILDVLTRIESETQNGGSKARQREISEKLANLLARQKAVHQDTVAATGSASGQSLSTRQRLLGRETAGLQRLIVAEAQSGAGGSPQWVEVYAKVNEQIDSREVKDNMYRAAEQLAEAQGADALTTTNAPETQQTVITDLTAILKMLRDPALADAKKEIEQLSEDLQEISDQLDRMERDQSTIVETAKQLRANADKTDGREEQIDEIKELEEARDAMEEMVEQLVKDLHVLPESDISNDLLGELAEVYEEVNQKSGSENDPVSEVAVDRDEGLLAMIKSMQEKMGERIGDLEMWLMDHPDSTQFLNENFDRDELGVIPLGDLPEALEDIVGDMTEQAEDLQEQAQDSTSNNAIPDGLMGWDIGDGPMPTWSAKGKSGNAPPNRNEQTGRSGSGRQGQSSGELVGDTLKALEGSEVDARRTDDPFQSGSIKEEDPSAMDTKATGGGKMAGTTNTRGMEGNAPARNELAYRQLQRQLQKQRDDLKSVYSRARLMRLPTGELDRAVLEADAALRRMANHDYPRMARAQQQVTRSLAQTHAQLQGRPIFLEADPTTSQQATEHGATDEPIPNQYEQAVADYMRRIAEGD